MTPPGRGAGPLDDERIRDLLEFVVGVVCRLGVRGEDVNDLVQDTMADLVDALSKGAIRSTDGATLGSWTLTCTSRKVFRYRELQKRIADELKDDDVPLVLDGNAVILAREQIRRLSKEEITKVIDFEVDLSLSAEEQRRSRYEREKLLKKIADKKLSKHHWRNKPKRKPRRF